MKKLIIVLLTLSTAFSAYAASTLRISTVSGTTTGALTNLTISGNNTERLVWGVIIDSAGDGFDGISGNTSTYLGNHSLFSGPQTFNGSFSTNGTQQLFTRSLDGETAVASDDYLALASFVFANPPATGNVDGAGSTGNGSFLTRPLSAGISYPTGVASGDAFGLVWFDITNVDLGTTALTGTPNGNVTRLNSGLNFGFFTIGNFILPGDGTALQDYAPNFVGSDPLRTAPFQLAALIPEPSSALLLIGAGSLLVARRRRES